MNGSRIFPPYPPETQQALFGMGCFWGVEKTFWKQDGVYSTSVGLVELNFLYLHQNFDKNDKII